MTSATDMFAFLIGSNTSLPALRNFCFYAAFGILFTFFFQCTWFVAWLTVDEWRRARKGRDVLCCLTVPKNACCVCCAPRPDGRTKMGRWMGDVMGGFLAKPVVKVATIAAFAAIAAGGFAGCALMQIDADVNNFIPGGSYLKEWIGDTNTLFRSLGDGISIFTRDFDITTEANAQVRPCAFPKSRHLRFLQLHTTHVDCYSTPIPHTGFTKDSRLTPFFYNRRLFSPRPSRSKKTRTSRPSPCGPGSKPSTRTESTALRVSQIQRPLFAHTRTRRDYYLCRLSRVITRTHGPKD